MHSAAQGLTQVLIELLQQRGPLGIGGLRCLQALFEILHHGDGAHGQVVDGFFAGKLRALPVGAGRLRVVDALIDRRVVAA